MLQTVDVGTGHLRRLNIQAKKFPKRAYAAVDHDLSAINGHESNITIAKEKIHSFVDGMIKARKKTRHINFEMPLPPINSESDYRYYSRDHYDFKYLFEKASDILLPNGKIFVMSEELEFLENLSSTAKKTGLKPKPIKNLHVDPEYWKSYKGRPLSHFMGYAFDAERELYTLEITYGLKKAIPNKGNRRDWPRTAKT